MNQTVTGRTDDGLRRFVYSCRKDHVSYHLEVFDGFHVRIEFMFKVEKSSANDDDDEDDEVVLDSYQHGFYMRRDELRPGGKFRDVVRFNLWGPELPQNVEASIIDDTVRLAYTMLDDDGGSGDEICALPKVRPILVDVEITTWQSPGESQYEAICKAIELSGLSTSLRRKFRETAAEKALSIPGLEKVTLVDDGQGQHKQCLICLDTLSVGVKVNRLPCCHIYHGKCIRQWLRKSKSCPLCRCAMPCLLEVKNLG